MTGLVDWAVGHARTILAFIILSILAGGISYVGLPKEGSPNIDIPIFYISVPFQGAAAEDVERLIVKPLETKLRGIEYLKDMTAYATESHASMLLEFEFGFDKPTTMANVRDKVDQARTEMPDAAEEPTVTEFNISAFPIIVLSLSGEAPERTLLKLAKELQREIESVGQVLEANLSGQREEMFEVLIDPSKLEAFGITAQDLLNVVSANNRLIAAGAVDTGQGQFSVTLPSSFETISDVYELPVKVNGDRIVRLQDLATIRRTFEDAIGIARFNGKPTIAIEVKKRSGVNIIDTIKAIRETVDNVKETWPAPLKQSVSLTLSMDESVQVKSMVSQLESSVLTAILLVMIVVIATLGLRSALLVGLAIPCSFLLSFALLAALGMSVNNMVMFGMILAVGMLVDGAIVVAELADREITEGTEPREAYAIAAKRMFWPIISSTATTLCAFLPMLFWPGISGQFMSFLPITLIFVLSASLLVALIYLPVVGGLLGEVFAKGGNFLRRLNPFGKKTKIKPLKSQQKYTWFGWVIWGITGNPVMPFVTIGAIIFLVISIFDYFGENNNGTEFFVKTEPERAIVYIRARGNASLIQNDRLVQIVEDRILDIDGVEAVFTTTGIGGLEQGGGSDGPADAIGLVQLELAPWGTRRNGDEILADINDKIKNIPGIITELSEQKDGPQQGKPIQIRVEARTWEDLQLTTAKIRNHMDSVEGLTNVDDTRPLPGIEWVLEVDQAQAGRFGADVSSIGAMVQLVTRGAILGTARPSDTTEELDIRLRFPEEQRSITALDDLRLPTQQGNAPLSNFVERQAAAKVGEYARRDGVRFFLVRADVSDGYNPNQKIAEIQKWLDDTQFKSGVKTTFQGDQEEQNETQEFLQTAFAGALGLMFVVLLAQFNSIYNSILVLSAVVMSVGGVMIGMLVMGQTFSIIMTGTGIVALAGIVVNNNIVLIDTYQQFIKEMPKLEAIIRTAEQRIRPVMLTTITTMAGLTPMMYATSIDFVNGQINEGSPSALWWVQLATAVIFGLGFSTILTLMITPAALAARIWITKGIIGVANVGFGGVIRLFNKNWRASKYHADRKLNKLLRKREDQTLHWDDKPINNTAEDNH